MAHKKGDNRRAFARRRPLPKEPEPGKVAAESFAVRLSRGLNDRRAAIVYLVRFSVTAGVLLGIYYFPYDERGPAAAFLHRYLSTYASLAGAALSIFDRGVHVDGTHILGRFNLDFAMNCDAMDVYILFCAAVVACPSSWRSRLVGASVGLAALVATNVARILSLYWVGVHFPSLFEFFHVDLWPIVIIAATCAGFLVWARAAGVGRGLSDAQQP